MSENTSMLALPNWRRNMKRRKRKRELCESNRKKKVRNGEKYKLNGTGTENTVPEIKVKRLKLRCNARGGGKITLRGKTFREQKKNNLYTDI
jgi:hypothetical protein